MEIQAKYETKNIFLLSPLKQVAYVYIYVYLILRVLLTYNYFLRDCIFQKTLYEKVLFS